MAVVIYTYKTENGADNRVESLRRRGIKSITIVKGVLGYKVMISKADFIKKYAK